MRKPCEKKSIKKIKINLSQGMSFSEVANVYFNAMRE